MRTSWNNLLNELSVLPRYPSMHLCQVSFQQPACACRLRTGAITCWTSPPARTYRYRYCCPRLDAAITACRLFSTPNNLMDGRGLFKTGAWRFGQAVHAIVFSYQFCARQRLSGLYAWHGFCNRTWHASGCICCFPCLVKHGHIGLPKTLVQTCHLEPTRREVGQRVAG